jgi:hypothetical protein
MKKNTVQRLLFLSILFISLPALSAAEESSSAVGNHEKGFAPLVIYYSRTGTSAMVAHRISDVLSCEREEVRSKKNRFYLGTFTCVNDQLFDRDDENEPGIRNVQEYNPLIIVSPIWIHKFASPMRTYLKKHSLKGKEVYVFATNQGNYSKERDEQELHAWLSSLGAQVKTFNGIMTKGKPWETLRTETDVLLKKTDLLKNIQGQPEIMK